MTGISHPITQIQLCKTAYLLSLYHAITASFNHSLNGFGAVSYTHLDVYKRQILSSFNSVLNSASTIYALDIHRPLFNPTASDAVSYTHLQKNLMLRHRVTQVARNYFDEHGFLEIETPMLTKSTPEGCLLYTSRCV